MPTVPPFSPAGARARAWWPAPAAVVVLYLLTRQHIFTIDSLFYLWNVEHADWRALMHPHRLAVEPLLRGWWRLWQAAGWSGGAVLPLQVFNTLVTAVALAVGGRLIHDLTRSTAGATTPHRAATLMATGWWSLLVLSYLPWHQATQAEGLPLFLLAGTSCLLWAVRLAMRPDDLPPRRRTALGLALLITGSVLVHQSLVLWAPLLAGMLAWRAPAGHRLQLAAIALAPAALVVAASYAAVGILVLGLDSPAALARWCVIYGEEFADRCGSVHLLFSWDVVRGLSAAFLTGAPLKPYVFGERSADLALVSRLLPFVLVGILLIAALARLPRLWRAADLAPARRAAFSLLVLMAMSALFAGWWEPANRKFWAPVLPGLVALAALGWQLRPGPGGMIERFRGAAPLAVALAVGVTNLAGAIWPAHWRHDADQPLLGYLEAHIRSGDTVILAESRPWQCAVYFRPSLPVHGIPGPWSDRDDPEHTVLRAAVADARRALEHGAQLYVASCQWPVVARALAADHVPLPEPEPVLQFVDEDCGWPWQTLLRVGSTSPRSVPTTAAAP